VFAPGGNGADDSFAKQRRLIAGYQTAYGKEDDMHNCKTNYTYKDMLACVKGILHAQNPNLIKKKCRTMKSPQLMQVLTKKTLWVNFQEICTMMLRSSQHVFQFFMAELRTKSSIDGNQQLVIQIMYVPKYIKSLLRRYIMSYVTCKMCHSPNTKLARDPYMQLNF
jgi:translation initiation factor 2 subunit 2